MNLEKSTEILVTQTLKKLGLGQTQIDHMSNDRRIEALCKMANLRIAALEKERDSALHQSNIRQVLGAPSQVTHQPPHDTTQPDWTLGTR